MVNKKNDKVGDKAEALSRGAGEIGGVPEANSSRVSKFVQQCGLY